MKHTLASLPLGTKIMLIVPTALLLVLLVLTTPLLGVPLVLVLLVALRPELLSPTWWKSFSADKD
ncbi:MAG: hypothetical protein JXQ91_20310 [Vannielia sp.]|uniref:hypothetical protein n=1 Tax=Vannielia sp. TaxID=2813045 RepID=UPI003B8BA784